MRDLQNSANLLQQWSDKWLLKLNTKKCKIISFGRNADTDNIYSLPEGNSTFALARETHITDLGVILDNKLTFYEHIHSKIKKAFGIIGILKRNFRHMPILSFVLLYKSMVRSHLEYCNSVWSPYKKLY